MNRLLILIILTSCASKHVTITDKVDPDIVLINIGEGDRSFIGKVLLTIDSCNPKLIGVDASFIEEKDSKQDSVLSAAFKNIDNDILGYIVDSVGQPLKSHIKFRSNLSDEGLTILEQIDGVSSHITPVTLIDNEEHELFALKIIKLWSPDFVNQVDKGESIPINFTRTLDQFVHFNGSELTKTKNFKDLNNKIVLLGYLGPSNEDKHFTPMRQELKIKDNEPDTYGVVIIANEIRTILNYKD